MENPLTTDAQQTYRNVRLGRDSRTAARRREDERTVQAALTILQETIRDYSGHSLTRASSKNSGQKPIRRLSNT